ncbi:major outer membrane protein OMP-1H [Ehrlichia chaffeensis str. Arkansas]|uniref:Major outer membrane protein OMP-1H n=2 Tax=Ehrlichia chaffeensis TaxID=945 RepID=Q2GF66_EHRCR|nr:P44/Msp2 family outer membrane protein [Ehrlichia chaffeensis]AAF73420.1 P28-11 [Ehrlichia chaffeensis]AAK28671.1 major outer membrane protein OMP-1H [Ehrlichia chaffeensis]ABD44654.1 major outer membrane protein OMP-1H [Ehrlichia chaffeensis str. Arkansas]AHX07391.1 surface antigen family protein [Ehrlichia chaffeensis str. Osceola]
MNHKSMLFTIGTALISLLSLPNVSFSGIINNNANNLGIYISGQYKPSVSVFSNFSVKETNFTTQQLVALKKDIDSVDISTNADSGINNPQNFTIPYIPKFQDNAASFSGALGFFYARGLRLEMEGSYEEFDVKNPGGYTKVKDAYRYFALAREMQSGQTCPKHKETSGIQPHGIYHTVMRNDGVSISSVIINGCYNFTLSNLPISPYMCVGMGIDAIQFFDSLHIKFAHQSKLGITYPLSSNVHLFADSYYHKVIGNKFKNLRVQHVYELQQVPKVTSAVATLDIGYFGGEVGVRFIL